MTEPKKWQFKILSSTEQSRNHLTKEITKIVKQPSDVKSHVSQILPNLWLGNKYIAHDLEFITTNGIKYIINITDNINNKFDFVSYVNFKVRDVMACETDTLDILKQGAEIINVVLHHNLPILIHCKQGHHRSASIIAFYLMQYHHLSLLSALRLIKQIRPRAFRRISCMLKTLIDYEVERMKS